MTTDAIRATSDALPRVGADLKPLPPAREIPATFAASMKSWWAAGEKDSAKAEERLLRMLPFYQSATCSRQNTDLPIVGTSSRAMLTPPNRFLNVFSITHTAPPATPS
ncbi:hypothetical protein EW145_g8431, partial [Phellinidium pouzarii]